MLKIRRSRDRLIFNMGFPYLEKMVFTISRGPASPRESDLKLKKAFSLEISGVSTVTKDNGNETARVGSVGNVTFYYRATIYGYSFLKWADFTHIRSMG